MHTTASTWLSTTLGHNNKFSPLSVMAEKSAEVVLVFRAEGDNLLLRSNHYEVFKKKMERKLLQQDVNSRR